MKIQNIIWLQSMSRKEKVFTLKSLRKHFLYCVVGNEPIKFKTRKWIKFIWQRSDNRISRLLWEESRVRSNDNFARAILSILWVSRDLNLKPEIDLASILTENKSDECQIILDELENNFSHLGMPSDPVSWWEMSNPEKTFSSKQGPNGPATVTGFLEVLTYSDSQIEDISTFSNEYVEIFSDLRSVPKIIADIRLGQKLDRDRDRVELRRLSAIADYEGKTRIIAIGDYLSQLYLKPVHQRLMKILRKLPGDLTFRQDELPSIIWNHWIKNRTPTSTDLKTATDRLPVSVSAKVLSKIWMNEDLSKSWLKLMATWDFKNCNRQSDKKHVQYKVGQPMGLYSSWPALALTNHALVRLSAHRIGFSKFKDYLILGDDTVIFNKKVEVEYRETMKKIGVEIDLNDSFSCSKTHSLEIAKRIFRKGLEVSPIPLRLIDKDKSLFQLYLLERGYNFNVRSTFPDVISHRSQLAANLLWFFRNCPRWKEEIIEDYYSSTSSSGFQRNHWEKLLQLDANSDLHPKWRSILGDQVLRQVLTLEEFKFRCESGNEGAIPHYHFHLCFEIAEKWTTIESYKIYDDYENFIAAQNVSRRSYRRHLHKNLINRKLRPNIAKGPLSLIAENWRVNYTVKGVRNTSIYRYENVGSASKVSTSDSSQSISIGQYFDGFSQMVETIRGWTSVKVTDVWLDSRETLDQQNILQLVKIIENLKLIPKVEVDLNNWVLTKLKLFNPDSKRE